MTLWIQHPWWLALLAAIPALAYPALRALPLTMSNARAWSAVAARALLIASLALALAGAASVRQTDRLAVIAVIDTSDSVALFANRTATPPADPDDPTPTTTLPDQLRRFIEQAAEQRQPDDLLGVVLFDGRAVASLAPTARRDIDPRLDVTVRDGTNIADALRFANLIAPAGAARRIVLVSDGAETDGDASIAARELAAAGTPVDVVPIQFQLDTEVIAETLDVPPRAPEGAAITARAVFRATAPSRGSVRLFYADQPLPVTPDGATARPVTLAPGRNVVTFEVPLSESRVFHSFQAVYTPDAADADAIASNNTAKAFTITRAASSALLVADTPAGSPPSALQRTLENAGVRVTPSRPADIPTTLIELQAHDLVILDNVAAWQVEPDIQQALAEHVSVMGAGLVMVGGVQSFGAGSWKGTPIDDILPLELDVPDEVLISQAAVAIVLDNSGSMARPVQGGTRSQQAIANAGAAQAVLALDTRDQLMVVAFNSTPSLVVPMGPNTDIDQNAQRVRSISSGGGTRMLPAMRIAGDALANVEAKVKHMIMLTDGRSEEGQVEMAQLAKSLNELGITTTTIAVGDGADTRTLQLIAANGGGAYYRVDDPRVLPSIFVKEVSVVRRPLVREGAFDPVITDPASPLLLNTQGFALTEPVPPLEGIVLTRTKDDPKITNALADPEAFPLLSHWFVGRGRVTAFTSDADPTAWAAPWLNTPGWDGYDALWTQIAAFNARPPLSTNAELVTRFQGDRIAVRYDALDDNGQPIDGLAAQATLTSPDGKTRTLSLTQTAPGRYEATADAPDRGDYIVAVDAAPDQRSRASLVIGGATKSAGVEQQRLDADPALLRAIAATTDGRVLDLSNDAAAQLWQRNDLQPARASTPLWPLLLAIAITIFTLDVGTRRLAWDRLLTREFADEISQHAKDAVASRADAAARTAQSLRDRFNAPAPVTDQRLSSADPATRSTPKPAQAATDDPLAAERAARIAARQREQRDRLRKDALRTLAGEAGPPKPDNPTDTKPVREQANNDRQTSPEPATEGLLAAKRRAAARRAGRTLDDDN